MKRLRREAEDFVESANYSTFTRVINETDGESLKGMVRELTPSNFVSVFRILADANPLLFAKHGEDPFELMDLMPRFLGSRWELQGYWNIHMADVYEFDEKFFQYKVVETHRFTETSHRTLNVPGTEILISLENNEILEWTNFKARRITTIPQGNNQLMLALPDGTFFFARHNLGTGWSTLIKVSPDAKTSEVEVKFGTTHVFPLRDDRILISGTMNNAQVLSLNLEVLAQEEIAEVFHQLSPTKFVLGGSGVWENLVCRFVEPLGFKVLQDLPRVVAHLFHDTLICSPRYGVHSVWKFNGEEYQEFAPIDFRGTSEVLGELGIPCL